MVIIYTEDFYYPFWAEAVLSPHKLGVLVCILATCVLQLFDITAAMSNDIQKIHNKDTNQKVNTQLKKQSKLVNDNLIIIRV